MKHVPYRGSAGATRRAYPSGQDLVGGHVSAAFQAVHVAVPLRQNDQLRLLAVAGKERTSNAPGLPTLVEQGAPVEVDLWYEVFTPYRTPATIVARYNLEINEIISAPQIAEKARQTNSSVLRAWPCQLTVEDIWPCH